MSKRETRPRWLETLLENTFFEVCHEHRDLRESKINIFCIDCGLCFCTHCFSGSSHAPHRHLQIRHNMYQDVVEVDDLNKLFDCSKIQISEEGVKNNDSSPTSHLEAEEAFPPPSSSSVSQERGENSMDGSDEGTVRPKKRIRRRKGVPHRNLSFTSFED
ncbi:hypothetical protein QJS10_CPA09g00278 [Acorus calamus]|uniref:B box-type domain-containing protein n=1 Tax=Acorus calamus TaxID=4465 RepID=A0AAV9E6E7_ACOCL|nr:hypothetical protein QJS10_CPA09g00278 [Acorus calamus]